MKSSELSGFYRLSLDDRRARVAEVTGLSFSELLALSATCGLSDEQANRMVENVLGVTSLPLGVCVNLRVDGRDCLVPMATEEPSVVAGASHAAKLLRLGGGVSTEVSPAHMVGQVQLLDVPDPEEAIGAIQAAKPDLLARANEGDPQLVAAGGGALDLELQLLEPLGPEDPAGPMLVVHLIVDVRDAMGANAINSMCERIALPIEQLSRGRVGLRILSNLADRRRVVARGSVPLTALGGRGADTSDQLARRIVEASVFAERDPYRAATHNKGIMNGIDAVLLALGQDWRAVEAGAHAYAARDGRYTALARWRLTDQSLTGELELPMAVGTIGGVQGVHPTVQVNRRLAHVGSASELASIVAAVGLTQNLSALRALSAEGIQRGHMRLHARNLAAEAGATGDVIDEVAEAMASRGTVSLSAAKEALAQREARRHEASRIPAMYHGEGDDSLIARFSTLRDQYWPAIADHIDQVLQGTTPEDSSLTAMCGYHMDTGGKRLRALLPLMVAEALGESPDKLVALGAACEMLHNATLVHDDLQDGDLVRRGQMTVWNRFGVPQAINLGDAMFYFAVLLCQRVEAPAPRREALVQRLLKATLRVIDGQEREFSLKARGNVSLDDYCTMVEGKTSGLFALPMAGAAELCGAKAELIEGLEEAARHLGVLFQIQDDTLDIYGDKGRELRGSDIAEGKRSALVVHALEHASEDDARWLLGVLDKERTKTSRDEIAEAARLLETTGSLRFALDEIEARRERAAQVPAVMANETLHGLVVAMSDLFLKPIAPLLER